MDEGIVEVDRILEHINTLLRVGMTREVRGEDYYV